MSFNNSNNVYVLGDEEFRKEREIQSEAAITVLSSALKAPKNLFDILKKQDYGFKICEIVKDTVKPVHGDLKECGGRFFDQTKKILIENPSIGVDIVINCEIRAGFTSEIGGTQTYAHQSTVGVVMTINCFDKEDCPIPGIVEAQHEILEVIAKDKLKDITTILQICKILLHSAGKMNITGPTWKRLNASLGQPNGKTYTKTPVPKTPSPKKTIKGKEKVVEKEKEKEKEKEPEQEACKELFTFEGMEEVEGDWRNLVLFGDKEDEDWGRETNVEVPLFPNHDLENVMGLSAGLKPWPIDSSDDGELPEPKKRDADLDWMDRAFGVKAEKSVASNMVRMSREKREKEAKQREEEGGRHPEYYALLDKVSPEFHKTYAANYPDVWRKYCEYKKKISK